MSDKQSSKGRLMIKNLFFLNNRAKNLHQNEIKCKLNENK